MTLSINLYIGTELADFNEVFNVVYSIGDVREIGFGSNNKTYTLNIPLTKTNKRLLKFINVPGGRTEITSIARLYLNDILIMQGKLRILGSNDYSARCIIEANDWIDNLNNKKLSDLDLSAYNYTFDNTNVVNSWTASYPFYRYPFIWFGQLQSLSWATGYWPTDFIPMWQITSLISAILTPYTISSTILGTAYLKDLYLLANEKQYPDVFITKKGLNVSVASTSDNYNSNTGSGPTLSATINKNVVFNTETTDEGSDFVTDTYTVPETGTYRFQASITMFNNAYGNPGLTITQENFTLDIKKNGSSIAGYDAGAYSGTELIDGKTASIDTYYQHFEAGDTITVALYVRVIASLSTSQTITIYATLAGYFKNVWGQANKCIGVGKTIHPDEMMPDISQLDFLSAIRDIFNLRFFFDKSRQVMYIENWDSFLSSTVIDLTSFIDNADFPFELIAPNYNKTQTFKWQDDKSDKAYEKYLMSYPSPGQKSIVLNSGYCKSGELIRENLLSGIVTGTTGTTAITAEDEFDMATYQRLTNFAPRIVHWDGVSAGLDWYYNGAHKTDYPKISNIDWNTIYSNYLQKFFHYIDKGKIYTVSMKLKTGMLTEFMTVVNTATSEGFRPTYKIKIKGEYYYFFLQKITTDGVMGELELVLKQ